MLKTEARILNACRNTSILFCKRMLQASANRWAAQLEETAEMPTESWRPVARTSSALHVSSSRPVNMINITAYFTKRITVDPGQAVHVAVTEAFGCQRRQQVQRVLFGDMDVLDGERFEDHGIEVGGVTLLCERCRRLSWCSQQLTSGSVRFACVLATRMGRGSA